MFLDRNESKGKCWEQGFLPLLKIRRFRHFIEKCPENFGAPEREGVRQNFVGVFAPVGANTEQKNHKVQKNFYAPLGTGVPKFSWSFRPGRGAMSITAGVNRRKRATPHSQAPTGRNCYTPHRQ
jgi:hypothetical protein